MAGEKPHSTAHQHSDSRLSAPSAARNLSPILEAMGPFVPKQGVALELASGTGEHIVEYARAFPDVIWQPTDIEPTRLNSIDAWRAEKGVQNMRMAQFLDASAPSWRTGPMSMIVTVNLMHLIDTQTARAVIAGVSRNLAPGASWFLYGPFRTGGAFRSEGDEAFHASLTAHDAQIGYKDLEKIEAWSAEVGLRQADLIEMPANNLAIVLRKTGGDS
ncbi:DUF938 domain-containing protein [Aliiroseovarius sp. F20344]|uniref:DUF938 domain-containing protein n=1 Tax=Aliiroseovarius sp. F20344 TaxID=2926414 RepID=UPI001FF244BD|nr:DUF938 domain-containing protein [Aliiroseovarius sp. F20344]MCK0141772.1 class I SAM-dependent methyltransferase [Aliiroseovarius sp. F20344]